MRPLQLLAKALCITRLTLPVRDQPHPCTPSVCQEQPDPLLGVSIMLTSRGENSRGGGFLLKWKKLMKQFCALQVREAAAGGGTGSPAAEEAAV